MATFRGIAGSMAVCAAVSVMLTGCGSDSSDSSVGGTPADAAAASTTTMTTLTQGGVTTADSTASSPLTGWAAIITIGDHLTKSKELMFNGLLVPVTIDVTSGSVLAAPPCWKVHTLSGKTLSGSSSGSIPTAIGDRPLDRDADGLIPFARQSTSDLADDVSITEVALYATSNDLDPIARWALPKPLAVKDIPAAGQ